MPLIAKLDKNNHLIGYNQKSKPSAKDVVVDDECDLPPDGTYKWDGESGAFVPVGHGFGRPKKAPISNDRVLYHIVQWMGSDAPQEVRDWASWYDENMKRRDEEMARVK